MFWMIIDMLMGFGFGVLVGRTMVMRNIRDAIKGELLKQIEEKIKDVNNGK